METVQVGRAYVCVVQYWREVHPGQEGYAPGAYKKSVVCHVRHQPFPSKRLEAYDEMTDYVVVRQYRNEPLADTKARALKLLEPSEITDVVDGPTFLDLVKKLAC